jgi:3-oxoacyl-[acyl-carrier-protein] synthase-3
MTRARIVGLGKSLPEKILTNHDLEKIVETSDEWITSRTGIRERRIAADTVSSSQLALPAVFAAMEKAGISPTDIDLIICATATPDMSFPSTACLIQTAIGAADCPAFDISAACSGFIYGLSIGEKYIAAGAANNVLVVASEVLSRIIDWSDRATCVLFGDGAGAAVLQGTEGENGILASRIQANGEYADFLMAGAGSASGYDGAQDKSHCIKMKGNQTFKVAVRTMTEAANDILTKNGFTAEDIDLVVPHQANMRIIAAVGKSLGVAEEKVFVNVDRYGNTSAATIPIALTEAEEEGRLNKGDLVCLVAFGGGFTWGASLIRW